jgi:hypothetical protein
MSRHASLEDLASFIEGVLRPRKSGRIASHLAGCSMCTGHVQDLQQVPVMLANVAYPPIPDALAGRIEMAIAAESVTRVTVSSDGGQPVTTELSASRTVTAGVVSGEASRRDLPRRRHRQPRRGWRMPGFSSPLAGSLAAVGAAVVIAGGGYAIASHLGGTSAGQSGTSAHVPMNASRAAAGGSAAGPANGPLLQYQQLGRNTSIPSVVTKTNFLPDQLQTQAEAALVTARATRIKATQGMGSPLPMATGAEPSSVTQLSKCVSHVAAGRNVLLVDLAYYRGRHATIIVVGTPPSGPGTIYAVGGNCSASDTDILAQRPLPSPSH